MYTVALCMKVTKRPFYMITTLSFSPSLSLLLCLSPELSETGRMLSTALSDGYLSMHDTHSDLSPHHQQLSASLDGRHFGHSTDDTLFPPLTQNDRHPSAPQLVSMLTDNKADVMLQDDVVIDSPIQQLCTVCSSDLTTALRVHI